MRHSVRGQLTQKRDGVGTQRRGFADQHSLKTRTDGVEHLDLIACRLLDARPQERTPPSRILAQGGILTALGLAQHRTEAARQLPIAQQLAKAAGRKRICQAAPERQLRQIAGPEIRAGPRVLRPRARAPPVGCKPHAVEAIQPQT